MVKLETVFNERMYRPGDAEGQAKEIWQLLFNTYIEKGGCTTRMNDLLVDLKFIQKHIAEFAEQFPCVVELQWAFDISGLTELVAWDERDDHTYKWEYRYKLTFERDDRNLPWWTLEEL